MAGINNIVKSVARKSLFDNATPVVDTTTDFDQGDLLRFDGGTIKRISSEGQASTFCGVAVVTVRDGRIASPYSTSNDAGIAVGQIAGPAYGVIATFILKSGDALAPGAAVYADPDTGDRHVQDTGTKSIGIYQGVAVTGDGELLVDVLLGARYPNDTLKF